MGVTVRSPHYEIDLGYFGFFRLRRKVAELLGEEIGAHYDEMRRTHTFADKEAEDAFWEQYDARTEFLASQKPKNTWKVFEFLYAPDCDGKVTYGACKQILAVIGDYDDNLLYGYAGHKDCAKFADFKRIMEDCAATKRPMRWS
ncbi:MAG: hypothetical protein J5973_08890 [Eubacterium sp.]|nr:hypothetical protein [Eubacterium sp.]